MRAAPDSRRKLAVFLSAGVFLTAAASPGHVSAGKAFSDPAVQCKYERLKEAAKYAKCLLHAEARALRRDTVAKVDHCKEKFATLWDEADVGDCGQTVETPDFVSNEMESAVFKVAVSIEAGMIGGVPLVDNEDGTVTDPNTGLMWEKKDESGGVHDVDLQYKIQSGLVTVADVIAEVNSEGEGGFAGFDDWRLPTVEELSTLVRYDLVFPAIDPVFDQNCEEGCTVDTCSCASSGYYWTDSGYEYFDPNYNWIVGFFDGHTTADPKWAPNFIRLVRTAE